MRVVLAGLPPPRPSWGRRIRRAALLGLGRLARRRGELCVVLVSDRDIRRLNRRFLGKDCLTDVLAFPYAAASEGFQGPPRAAGVASGEAARPPFGDIYIAFGVARRQARELGHPLLEELLTLAAHGALHLAGYDDHAPARRRVMFARQDRIVRGLLGGR